MGSNCCTSSSSVSKENEVNDLQYRSHSKTISDVPKDFKSVQREAILVRNVKTGITIDLRWIFDSELSEWGMDGDEMIEASFID